MKKLLLLVVCAAVGVIVWWTKDRAVPSSESPAVAFATQSSPPSTPTPKSVVPAFLPPPPPPVAVAPAPVASMPAAALSSIQISPLVPPPGSTIGYVDPKPWPVIPPPIVEPGKPNGPPAPLPQINLTDVLGPNNFYHDDVFGVSATYPDGWSITGANRWGVNNSENTVPLRPDVASTARPSMYYQKYPNGYPELEGVEAYAQRVAQNKENQRITGGLTDYKNVPASFKIEQLDGRSIVSYFAAYTQGDDVRTEYFVRVLGKQGYVMFFVPGKMEDVQAMMPKIDQMAKTVKVP
jgi:hypothetical protein